MIKQSYILITDNIGDKVANLLSFLVHQMTEEDELIIFDNHSLDETVPEIVGSMGVLWTDKNERFKFYINKTIESAETLFDKASSIARGEPILVDVSEVLADVKN